MTISYIWNTLSKQEEVTYEHGEEGIPSHVSCMGFVRIGDTL